MADINCGACEDLRQTDPNLIINGLGDNECTSLANNTGLSTSSKNDSCTDLKNLNDCLIGNMASEIDAYDVCDWKTFMKTFIPNLWTTIKGIICTICGLWKVSKRIDCLIDYMMNGASFRFGEMSSDTTSYIVAGQGVSFANVGASGTSSDISIVYIGGGLARISGSLLLYQADFTDEKSVWNYDNDGVNPRKTSSREGNPIWYSEDHKPDGGSALLYELRIKKSEFPQVKRFFSGFGLNQEGGAYHADFEFQDEGSYASGMYGHCNRNNGDPANANSSRGHLVPDGWMYIQCRITWIDELHATAYGSQFTPEGFMGIRMNQDAIDC